MKNLEKELQLYANLLIDTGFRVIKVKDGSTYIKFEKENKIGYVQYDKFRGFTFATVHKPNRNSGTGFQMESEVIEPTLQNAKDCFVMYPAWAKNSDRESVIKWKDLDDLLSKENILKWVEVTKKENYADLLQELGNKTTTATE